MNTTWNKLMADRIVEEVARVRLYLMSSRTPQDLKNLLYCSYQIWRKEETFLAKKGFEKFIT